MNDRFVDHTEWFSSRVFNKAIVSFYATDFDRGLQQLVGNDIVNTLLTLNEL